MEEDVSGGVKYEILQEDSGCMAACMENRHRELPLGADLIPMRAHNLQRDLGRCCITLPEQGLN